MALVQLLLLLSRAFLQILPNSGGPQGELPSRWVQEAGVRQFIAGTLNFAATDEPDQPRLMLPKVRRALFSCLPLAARFGHCLQQGLVANLRLTRSSGGCLP